MEYMVSLVVMMLLGFAGGVLAERVRQRWLALPDHAGFYCESCDATHALEATVRAHATLPPLPRIQVSKRNG